MTAAFFVCERKGKFRCAQPTLLSRFSISSIAVTSSPASFGVTLRRPASTSNARSCKFSAARRRRKRSRYSWAFSLFWALITVQTRRRTSSTAVLISSSPALGTSSNVPSCRSKAVTAICRLPIALVRSVRDILLLPDPRHQPQQGHAADHKHTHPENGKRRAAVEQAAHSEEPGVDERAPTHPPHHLEGKAV